jgi:hypothetical protein
MYKKIYFVAIALFFISCQKSNKELILNKWRLVNTTLPLTDSAKNMMYNEFLMQFNENNQYLVGFNDLKEVGTYTFSNDQKSIIITDKNSQEKDEIVILKLTSDTLKTRSNSKGIESVFAAIH